MMDNANTRMWNPTRRANVMAGMRCVRGAPNHTHAQTCATRRHAAVRRNPEWDTYRTESLIRTILGDGQTAPTTALPFGYRRKPRRATREHGATQPSTRTLRMPTQRKPREDTAKRSMTPTDTRSVSRTRLQRVDRWQESTRNLHTHTHTRHHHAHNAAPRSHPQRDA